MQPAHHHQQEDRATYASRAGFSGERAILERTIAINAPPDEVFPLLCPVREGEWLEGWVGRAVFSRSGVAEEHGVFIAEYPGQEDTIWFVLRHDAALREVEFLSLAPRLQVVRLFVHVLPAADGGSTIAVRYIRTGISEEGNALIRQAKPMFESMMVHWERSMNHFLATGTLLRVSA